MIFIASSGESDFVNTATNVDTTNHVVEVTSDSQVIYHNHPLFFYSSNMHDSSLITTKLIVAETYSFWSREMYVSL